MMNPCSKTMTDFAYIEKHICIQNLPDYSLTQEAHVCNSQEMRKTRKLTSVDVDIFT